MQHKNEIIRLRSEGKTYNEIQSILHCSKATISYHLGKDQKSKSRIRLAKHRNQLHPFESKIQSFIFRTKIIEKEFALSKSSSTRRIYFKILKFHKGNGMSQKLLYDGRPKFTVEDIINKFGEKPLCYLTGKQIDIYDTKSYHFDHIIPIDKGGDSSLDNLGICTKEANMAKNNMTPEEFIGLCRAVIAYQEKSS